MDEKIVLIPGQSEKEINEAKKIAQNVKQHKCDIIIDESLHDIALRIGGLKCFVSNDTVFLHLAATIGIPTIGLYVSTNAEIWSPYDKVSFFAIYNNYISKCPDPKPHCGNCFHYYDLCPAIAKYGDDIEPNKVYEVIKGGKT